MGTKSESSTPNYADSAQSQLGSSKKKFQRTSAESTFMRSKFHILRGAALGFGLNFAVRRFLWNRLQIETFSRSERPPKKPNLEAIQQSSWKWGPNPRAAPPRMQIQPSPSSAAQNFDLVKSVSTYLH